MNIFCLDKNPLSAAEFHCDKHVVKMILETCQLMSTAHRLIDQLSLRRSPDELLLGATHINHPSNVWVRQSAKNYSWLSHLLNALCSEYTYRYDKVHALERNGLVNYLTTTLPSRIDANAPLTLPTPAMPDDCKSADVVLAYRRYYVRHKSHIHAWKRRAAPYWLDLPDYA